MRKSGFTLTEVLIALALLGIVAAFTVPKVLESTNKRDMAAKVKEAVGILEQVWYEQRAKDPTTFGKVTTGGYDLYTFGSVIRPYINAIKTAYPNNQASYVALPFPGGHPCPGGDYIVLPNGVIISGLSDGGFFLTTGTPLIYNFQSSTNDPNFIAATEQICIDANGLAGPNKAGQDCFIGNFHFYGDFDDTGTDFVRSGGKNFHWGTRSIPVYNAFGNAHGSPWDTPESRIGVLITEH